MPPNREVIEAARRAWPNVRVDAEAFAAHVAALEHPETEDAVVLRAGDLYLAFACARKERWAVEHFHRELLPLAVVAARSIDRQGQFDDDIREQLSERLLVGRGEGHPPKIAEYSGRGPLENWVRVAAIRTALNLLPQRAAAEPLEAAAELKGADVELDFLKEKYRHEFKQAFEAAVKRVPADELNLLRMHVIDHLSIDKLCALTGVHRTTAARRLSRARQTLCEATRVELIARLGLRGKELDSVMRLVRSNVDLSIARLLRAEPR